MNRQQMSRKFSVIWHILQYTLFAIACIWLLYQIQSSSYGRTTEDCNHANRKLTERHFGKLLGRKGYVGSSYSSEEFELYGTNRVAAQDVNDSNESNRMEQKPKQEPINDSVLEWRAMEEFPNKEGEIPLDKNASSPRGHGDEMLISMKLSNQDKQVQKSTLKFGSVILKSDKHGFIKRESAPSRRSNFQLESLLQGKTSSFQDQFMELKASGQMCAKGSAKKRKNLKRNKYGEGGRRELLFTGEWLNSSNVLFGAEVH